MSKEKEPKYIFAEVPEGVIIPADPMKKQIAKIHEVTETFTLYDAIFYLQKAKKQREDKQIELTALDEIIEKYEEEIELIKEKLDMEKLEKDYADFLAEQAELKAKSEGEVEVESPYVEEK